jgi:hypothetical protein
MLGYTIPKALSPGRHAFTYETLLHLMGCVHAATMLAFFAGRGVGWVIAARGPTTQIVGFQLYASGPLHL